MKCAECGVEMFIDHAEYSVSGDNSQDTVTEVMHIPYFVCVNRECRSKGIFIKGEGTKLI